MKKYFYVALMCMAGVVLFSACNGNDPDKGGRKLNYSKLVGTWELSSYMVIVTNLDAGEEVEHISRNQGTMTVTKKTDDEGDTYYYYTENFVSGKGSYSGRFILGNGTIEMADKDGFVRSDGATTYDFTITKLTDTEMEWTYEVVQDFSRSSTGESYKRQTVAKAMFSR